MSDKKKKKKKIDNDTLMVLAILGSIIVFAVVCSLLNSGGYTPKLEGNLGSEYKAKDRSSSVVIVVACTCVSLFFVILFFVKKIRDAKRKARQRQKELEKIKKLKEIEAARERVKQAKMSEFLNAGQKELETRKREESRLKRSINTETKEGRFSDGYVRRDLNSFKDEDDLEDYFLEEEEEVGILQMLLQKVKKIFVRNKE